MRNDIGIRIMQLRFTHKMTQNAFAKHIGVSPRTLRRWESGEREPSIKHIGRILKVVKVDDVYDFIFGEHKDEEIPKLVYIL